MFEFFRGRIVSKTPGTLVLDVNGVGYILDIPVSTGDRLGKPGSETQILVHYHVREDIQKLYGFATSDERDAFRAIISISQVGPKVALSVLSSISVRDLTYAVASGDMSRLKSISGVGPKIAQRLAVELKGKLRFSEGAVKDTSATGRAGAAPEQHAVDREAFTAMISLGYSEAQVMRALARVNETIKPGAPVEEWIRMALQVI